MKPYKEYKDSGIPWIGKIPTDWELKKIKYNFAVVNGATPKSKENNYWNGDIIWVTPADYKTEDIFIYDSKKKITFEGLNSCGTTIVPVNSIIVSNRAPIGSIGIAQKNMCTNQGCKSLVAKGDISEKLIYYILSVMSEPLNMLGKGTTFLELSSYDLANFYLSLPSLDTQHRISAHLDRKTAAIDTLIADKQKMIELLKERRQAIISEAVTKGLDKNVKMKDSGIEWIGEIPDDWMFEKFNLICSTITDYVASGSFADLKNNVQYYDDENYAMLIRTLDVSNKNDNISRVYVNESAYNFLKNSNLYGGEIILPNIGASVGDVYIVPKLYKKMTLGPNTILFKTRYNDKYYYYYFCSKFGRECLILLAQSAAQPKFNKTELRRLRVLVPNTKIQNAIVNYLDKKTTEIDNLISDITKQIEKLKEYRQAIISEAVTGKVEI